MDGTSHGMGEQVSRHTPPCFDSRHAQWVARAFAVEGVVRDSSRASDADDLSQLTTVECFEPGPLRWRHPHVPMLYVTTGIRGYA